MKRTVVSSLLGATLALALAGSTSLARDGGQHEVSANPMGVAVTLRVNGGKVVDQNNPFFQDLGTNGRRCVTCHQPAEGFAISAAGVRSRFEATRGLDPLFRTNDGSNSPLADVSSVSARRRAYSMLLTKGLIRVGIGIPGDAEFELSAVDDPYGYASSAELSLFRRPLPTTNLPFITAVMWDGREGTSEDGGLLTQANDATMGHAQATTPLTPEQRRQIVAYETSLYTAQIVDGKVGSLLIHGARGGPEHLSREAFYLGINDLLGDSVTGAPFSNLSMTLFGAWEQGSNQGEHGNARRSVARGQALFNSKPIRITGVAGVNDNPAFGAPAVVNGTCTTCHDTPNIGNHSVKLALDIGLADASRRTPDMPLYTLRNKVTGATVATTDPGRALISGKWSDIGKFKGPVLRGLASRAPYFHNGSARDLNAVLDFYDERFGVGFTPREREDLVAFLRSL